jgi:hypothetical protein
MKRILLCAALMAFSSMASAVVYKWVDAQGKVQYGDRPPDGVHAEIMEMIGPHGVARPAQPAAAPAKPAPAAARATASTVADDPARKAVQEDVEAARAKQCTDAQERYRKSIEGRRLYRVGSDGEREYLTSEEIDAERLNAKRDVDAVCNNQN